MLYEKIKLSHEMEKDVCSVDRPMDLEKTVFELLLDHQRRDLVRKYGIIYSTCTNGCGDAQEQ